jgi:hypothetical protein
MPANAWIVSGAINTQWGMIDPTSRYEQTVRTLQSIKLKDATACVILVDNSVWSLSPAQNRTLAKLSDHMFQVGDRKFSKLVNAGCMKGTGETHMWLLAMNHMAEQKIQAHRMFKLSGRYWLADQFDIHRFDGEQNRYCFKSRDLVPGGGHFFHIRMWGVCGQLTDHAIQFMKKSCAHYSAKTHGTLEEAMFDHMDLTLLTELDRIHVEGWIASSNQFVQD